MYSFSLFIPLVFLIDWEDERKLLFKNSFFFVAESGIGTVEESTYARFKSSLS